MQKTFAEQLAAIQERQYRELASTFATVDVEDDTAMALAMLALFRFTDISAQNVSDGLGLTNRAPERWSQGRCHVHPLIRRTVIDWIVRELRERADMIAAFPDDLGHPADDYIPRRFLPYALQART